VILSNVLCDHAIGYLLKPLEVQAQNEVAMRIGAFRIGDLAERTGVSVATIRYYEEIGLIRPAARQGGQRIYDHADAHRLAFIRRCRDFDFSIDEIRSLLSLMHAGGSCSAARELAEGHLVDLRRKLSELQALERTIASLVTACAATCDGGAAADCVILQPQ
jgi:MerR family transcriptional regulator, copper efflux regulator